MMGFFFRAATMADRGAIAAVHRAAFGRDEESDLALALTADGDAALSVLVEADGAAIAHVLYSPLGGLERALALAPLGVLPAHQREGVGSALVRRSLEMAGAEGWRAVLVVGEPAYYGRFGFSADLAKDAETPWSGPYLQALELVPGALSGFAGPLTYAPAFSRLK